MLEVSIARLYAHNIKFYYLGRKDILKHFMYSIDCIMENARLWQGGYNKLVKWKCAADRELISAHTAYCLQASERENISLQENTFTVHNNFLERAWKVFLSRDDNKIIKKPSPKTRPVSTNVTDVLKRAVLKK